MHPHSIKLSIALCFLLSLQACSSLTITPSNPAPDEHRSQQMTATAEANTTPATATDKETQQAHVRSFSSETLFALLVAEIAGSRQHPEITLAQYMDQAKKTRDPQPGR
ncbi:MAG: hypothetical protein KDI30_02115 [Pseudomonadales bacterium]|nr:hypothetical protein [Pseudomonadales bacterium]